MTLTHPLSWVPVEQEKAFLIALIVLCLVGIAGMGVADHHLRSEITPMGIVSFQLDGNLAEAERVLSTWGEEGRIWAAFSLGIDYLYLTANALLWALLAGWVGRKAQGRLPLVATLSPWIAWAFILAAVFDAVENVAFLIVVTGGSADPWLSLGTLFASMKFTLMGLGMTYLLVAGGLCAFTSRVSDGEDAS